MPDKPLVLTKEEQQFLDALALAHHETHLPLHHEAVHEHEDARAKLDLTTARFEESMAALRAVVNLVLTQRKLNPNLFSWRWDANGKTILIEKAF